MNIFWSACTESVTYVESRVAALGVEGLDFKWLIGFAGSKFRACNSGLKALQHPLRCRLQKSTNLSV